MKEFVVIDIRNIEPEEIYNYLLENNYNGLDGTNLEMIVKGYGYPCDPNYICLNIKKKIYEWVDDEDESIIEEDELRMHYHNSIEHIASFFLFKQLDKERVQV